MPYIKLVDRPMFDTMIDGLVSKIRGFDRLDMGQVAGSLVINALTPTAYAFGPDPAITEIIYDLGRRIRVRGDANYCVCRILLEGMKPKTGWGYHSLSDTVMACDAAIDLIYDVQRGQKLEDAQVVEALSVLGDVITEIGRRLLGPYEDTAILKNGDLACFANEDFAYKPLGLGLSVAGARSGRATCGCNPCGCGTEDNPESEPDTPGVWITQGCVGPAPKGKTEGKPVLDNFHLKAIKGLSRPLPIIDALTQKQYDSVDQERKSKDSRGA